MSDLSREAMILLELSPIWRLRQESVSEANRRAEDARTSDALGAAQPDTRADTGSALQRRIIDVCVRIGLDRSTIAAAIAADVSGTTDLSSAQGKRRLWLQICAAHRRLSGDVSPPQ